MKKPVSKARRKGRKTASPTVGGQLPAGIVASSAPKPIRPVGLGVKHGHRLKPSAAAASAESGIQADLVAIVDPFPINPFRSGSSSHKAWKEEKFRAERIVRGLRAHVLEKGPHHFTWDSIATIEALTLGAWARMRMRFIMDDDGVREFNLWVDHYIGQRVSLHCRLAETDRVAAGVMPSLRDRLAAEALRLKNAAAEVAFTLLAQSSTGKSVLSAGPVSKQVKKRRWLFIREYRDRKGHDSEAFARHVGLSVDTIKGIVREDLKRFAPARQAQLLATLGVTREQWYAA